MRCMAKSIDSQALGAPRLFNRDRATCPVQAAVAAAASANRPVSGRDGIVALLRETKGRRLQDRYHLHRIHALPGLNERTLPSSLKAPRLGGALKEGVIEIQGDQSPSCVLAFRARVSVKRAGG